jgi:membrane protease YdiL (CAAX protease family)
VNRVRLACWSALVLGIAGLGYASRFSGGGTTDRNAVYSWTNFANGTVLYAIWLTIVLGIASGRSDLLALRPPRSWGAAAKIGAGAVIGIYIVSALITLLPIRSPGDEQGLTPAGWQSQHAAAFAANVVLFAVIAPVVEELTFRGLGQSLLLQAIGRWPSILVVGVAFGVAHGLVEALTILVPFGVALAYLRSRTESVYPCILVHAVFNGIALGASVLH